MINDNKFDIVAINASYTPEQLAHLIQYDTIHGYFPCSIEYSNNQLFINGKKINIVNKRNPIDLPWSELGVNIVIESTGAFRTKESCQSHISAGAEKVIVTAPAKDDMKMIVMGVNDNTYQGESIISNASCTTNALAPIMKILADKYEIINGLMTTVHSYTNDQRNLDNPHKDLRRARACGMNMVPTSTGAAKAIGEVIPSLKGKMNGISIRVPTPDVSIIDVVVDVKNKVTKEEVNQVLKSGTELLKGILDYNELPLVSSDYISNPHSSIIDGLSTIVIDDHKIKILAWYDNEWGYSSRVVDLAKMISDI